MFYSVAKRQKEIMEKSPEGISTEFSGEDWQINSSPFPKISKFTYDIGIVASVVLPELINKG